MTEIEFREPPPSRGGREGSGRYREIAAAIRERPGEWAVLGDFANPGVASGGRMAAFRPATDFEATSRTRPDGRYDVFVRYVGTERP